MSGTMGNLRNTFIIHTPVPPIYPSIYSFNINWSLLWPGTRVEDEQDNVAIIKTLTQCNEGESHTDRLVKRRCDKSNIGVNRQGSGKQAQKNSWNASFRTSGVSREREEVGRWGRGYMSKGPEPGHSVVCLSCASELSGSTPLKPWPHLSSTSTAASKQELQTQSIAWVSPLY